MTLPPAPKILRFLLYHGGNRISRYFLLFRFKNNVPHKTLPIGAGLEDLGKGLRSQVGTMYSTKAKGVRYMEMAEGYVLSTALDENDEVIGYKFVRLGKML